MQHLKYIRFLTSPDGEARLAETIRRIWKIKLRLGLLTEPDKTAFGEAELKIYRGADQIGGGCTEITAGGERILIDFGANLPNPGNDAAIQDAEMAARVFDGRPTKAVLFTHYHGDHYGLYKEIPDVPMYIGPLAKQILQVLVPRLDYRAEVKGAPIVESMSTYDVGDWMELSPNFLVMPLYVDHSALDAYMLYIKAGGKAGTVRSPHLRGVRGAGTPLERRRSSKNGIQWTGS